MSIWWELLLAVGALLLVFFVWFILQETLVASADPAERYKYGLKKSLLTATELGFYKALSRAVGGEYLIVPQVNLSTFLYPKDFGSDKWGALQHINRKSVDFVLCDRTTLEPKVAIELDDYTHERADRIERDTRVEKILKGAGLPLIRIPVAEEYSTDDLTNKITTILI